VPQRIPALTDPATPSPATAPATDTPAGRVAALAGAVASGQAELASRETESQSLQQQITGRMQSAPVVATGSGYGGGKLLRPVPGPITSGYGNRLDPYYHVWQLHPGIDMAAPPGTPIGAAAAGRVTQAGWYGGYGNYTCIEHGQVDGQRLSTCYGHQSTILVAPGQQVAAGQIIGLVGSTGASTGPHLHFEVRIDGRPIDPLPWIS
jgi:murein DD-endopeptidase MepM/ murein hydrolase activator NlpD